MKIVVEAESLKELKSLLEQLVGYVPSGVSIDVLPLNARTEGCLKAENIQTVEQLAQMSDMELLKVPNLGRRSLNEIRDVLKTHLFVKQPSPIAEP